MRSSEENLSRAVEYLRASPGGFWVWDDDRPAVAWSDGRTIAFREEVVAVLERLAPHGLPPFDAIILLLAACRDGFCDETSRTDSLQTYAQQIDFLDRENSPLIGAAGAIGSGIQAKLASGLQAVMSGLTRVAHFSPDLRGTLSLKCALAEAVFEGGRRDAPADVAAAILNVLRTSMEFEMTRDNAAPVEFRGRFAGTLDALGPGLARLHAESFRLRVKTGLDELPKVAPLAPTAQAVRDLLMRLRSDSALGGLARLAQNLMAAVHVPRSLAAHEDMPLGGVSDLSTRGTFDRLLLSELAHDDLTLAVRVAMNEALYLRRESPPRQPPPRRTILIDGGIRLWGLPRAFATAAALALAATSAPLAEVQVYRATHAGPVRADLTTREGLVTLLAALEPDPQPGDSMQKLMDAEGHGSEPAGETVLITHPDVLADPEFSAATSAMGDSVWYAATVERDGSYALIACSRAGRKPVTTAKVSLDDIFVDRTALPLAAGCSDPNLPAFVAVAPCPLRLPSRIESRWAVTSKRYGAIGITHDGRLVQFDSEVRGARELSANLPHAARRLGLFVDEARGHLLLAAHARKKSRLYLMHVDLHTARVTSSEVPAEAPIHCWNRFGLLFLAYRNEVVARRPESGEIASRLDLKRTTAWQLSRFLITPSGGVAAVGYDGGAPALYPVTAKGTAIAFDRDDNSGPWLLQRDGTIQAADGSATIASGSGFSQYYGQPRISPDGHRIVVQTSMNLSGEAFRIDLAAAASQWVKSYGDSDAWLAGPALNWSRENSVQLRWRFDAVCVDADGTLRLLRRERDETSFRFHLNAKSELWLRDEKQAPRRSVLKIFTRATSPPGCHYAMRVALFSDGSRIYLDSRGLLHLKSVDRALPELTLTLSNVGVAGWTSEGQTFGWAYFLDGRPTATSAYAYDLLCRFARRLA